MSQIRKQLHNKLITDFTALQHDNDDLCFVDVRKIFLDFPGGTPTCQIIPSDTTTTVDGVDFNTRTLGFTAIVYEVLENNVTQTDTDEKIDRLSDIEDVVYSYLEKIPNEIGLIDGARVYKIDIQPAAFSYEQSENGIRVFFIVNFGCAISIDVKGL